MIYKDCLEIVAAWAAIFTAVVAIVAYGNFLLERKRKLKRLEKYLQKEKEAGSKSKHTLTHLVANLGMSETDIMDCAFRSKQVTRLVLVDKDTGKATGILLEHTS